MLLKAKAYDKINMFGKLTPGKILNSFKITSSFYYSKWFNKNIHWGLPVSMSFEPTTSCNLRCPECPSGLRQFTRPTGMADLNFYKRFIDGSKNHLWYLTLYFQGEPFLNPDFLKMVSYANKNNIYTATSTNAHYINDEKAEEIIKSGLNRLIISIDGTTQETYQSYRIGGKLEKVIEGTKKVIAQKKRLHSSTPHIIFQFLVVKPNEHQIDEVHQLAKELGVDEVKLKTAQVYNYKNGNDLIPENEKYSRYRKEKNGTYSYKNKMINQCWRMWQGSVVTFDGKLVPCCFDKDAENKLGDLQTDNLVQVWNGEEYKNFRKKLLKSRDNIEICKNCSEGTKVWT